MKQFVKENWFKISIVVLLFTTVLSIIYYFFFFIPEQQNGKSQTNDIALQAKCAAQAEVALNSFKKSYSGPQYNSFVQENHYNQKMDKCFVLISYSAVYPPNTTMNPNAPFTQPSFYEDLVDAYENTDLAHCTFFATDNPNHQTCLIKNSVGTYRDYKNFVIPRMEMPDPDK